MTLKKIKTVIFLTIAMVMSISASDCTKVEERVNALDMTIKQELAELREMNKKLVELRAVSKNANNDILQMMRAMQVTLNEFKKEIKELKG